MLCLAHNSISCCDGDGDGDDGDGQTYLGSIFNVPNTAMPEIHNHIPLFQVIFCGELKEQSKDIAFINLRPREMELEMGMEMGWRWGWGWGWG